MHDDAYIYKAFDRVNHVKLFSRMCKIGVPAHVIRLIMNWYSNIIMIVKVGEQLFRCVFY